MLKSENPVLQGLPGYGKDVQFILNSQEEALHHHTAVFLPSPKSQCFPSLTWTGENPRKIFKGKSSA